MARFKLQVTRTQSGIRRSRAVPGLPRTLGILGILGILGWARNSEISRHTPGTAILPKAPKLPSTPKFAISLHPGSRTLREVKNEHLES